MGISREGAGCVVIEKGASLRPGILRGLEALGLQVAEGVPDEVQRPVVVIRPPQCRGAVRRYAAHAYCLLVGADAVSTEVPENVTLVRLAQPEEALLLDIQHWLEWATVAQAESLSKQQLVGRSIGFCRLIAELRAAARFDAATLIRGETGTGKEGAARALHYWSARQDHSFIPVNCGGQNDDLFLTELFGHEKGAFTDAKTRSPGLIAHADGGTLFLDEINSLSPKSQAALLRFMQDQTYRPIGGRRQLRGNVRIIAATNQPMLELVRSGELREDLYYRLNVLNVELPSLRERQQDIPLLARHFLEALSHRYGVGSRKLAPATLAWAMNYSWPGNVRELENTLHRMFALSQNAELRHPVAGLGSALSSPSTLSSSVPADVELLPFQDAKSAALQEFERDYLERLLGACEGNLSLAARKAGKERRTFGRLVRKYGLLCEQYKSNSKPSGAYSAETPIAAPVQELGA